MSEILLLSNLFLTPNQSFDFGANKSIKFFSYWANPAKYNKEFRNVRYNSGLVVGQKELVTAFMHFDILVESRVNDTIQSVDFLFVFKLALSFFGFIDISTGLNFKETYVYGF